MSDQPKDFKQSLDEVRRDLGPLRKDGTLYDELVDLRTDERRAAMSELEPCCICQKDWNHPDELIDTLYPTKRHFVDGSVVFTEWNVACQIHNNGCGRTVYGETKEEAVSKWNRGVIDVIEDF